MTTTIQISDKTITVLKMLRDQFRVPSYDALLQVLIQKVEKPKKTLWGAGGKLSMKEILKNLRDEHDRY
ncbi:hypothetical protein HY483_00220 [Candidatus Woesearchaeota archaeon]|nr:hypothetical protein [Candidatus Woesearchaeota archaeon]